jgi:hypothetical protein
MLGFRTVCAPRLSVADDLCIANQTFINLAVSRSGLNSYFRRHGLSDMIEEIAEKSDKSVVKKIVENQESDFLYIDIRC